MPKNIDLLIEARWIAPVEPDTLLTGHAIAVADGAIAAILPAAEARTRYTPREHVQLDNHILIPGLINLHTHAAMVLMRGLADDLPLMTWLEKHVWPAEAAHVSPQFVHDGTRLACAEMLLGGVTCFNDMYFYPQAAAEAAVEMGMRAAIGITVLEFPTAYASDADDYIAKGLAVRDRWRGHPLVSFCLAPHAPYTVSDATFRRLATLAGQLDLPIHCHIHETQAEIERGLAEHGNRPLARLHGLNLLGSGFIGVHAVHLNPEEIAILARQGCSIAHCPTANLKLASGIAPVADLLAAGINVGLGTDGAASNNRLDLFQEMRLAALLAKGTTGDAAALGAATALRMATLNGAAALGLDRRIGSLRPGKAADICAVDLSGIATQPCYDPISHLVYAAGKEQVSHVWIGGKCCVSSNKLCAAAENDLKKTAGLWQNKLEIRPFA
mgnify:CR=1 FL=1